MDGHVCAVAGGKGGVGRTTTAINLGVAMEQFGHETVVVEADLDTGDLGTKLGLDPPESIQSVLAGEGELEEALVDAAGDVTVLPGESSLDAFAAADPAQLADVLDSLRASFDLVLVDTSAGVSHQTTAAVGAADETLLVTTPADAAVIDASLTAALTDRAGGTVVGAVVTRATAETDLSALGERLDAPVLGAVPDDPAATDREPLATHAVQSEAALWYGRVANCLADGFFTDATPADVEAAFSEEWFDDDGQPVIADDAASIGEETEDEAESPEETDESDTEDDDDSGGFGVGGLMSG
jgi:septum site-determining protein MinD